MKITAVTQKKGIFYDVFVEDEYFVTAPYETIFLHKIKPGADFSLEDLLEFRYQVDVYTVREKALSLLSFKAYTQKKLCEKLDRSLNQKKSFLEDSGEKRYPIELIEEVIEALSQNGLLDDRDYARRYAKDLVHFKAFGKARIRLELQKLGIARDIIDDTLEELEIDEAAAITAIIQRKYRSLIQDEKGKQKTIAALHRLGYAVYDVKAVIAQLGESDWP